jgi:cyclic pyranopterin phosphate synthase
VEEPGNDTEKLLIDGCGRLIDYLRISVTDRCNFRCFYCMPGSGVPFIPVRRILRYEEMLEIADIFLEMGVRKIRVTGGEPLVRKNILFLFRELGRRKDLSDLSLTTNGTYLCEYAGRLKDAGVKRINVSLDSLNSRTFERITGLDSHRAVVQGIEKSEKLGLKVKINVVAMKGVNDGEFTDFVEFGMEKSADVRFIEVMPQVYNTSIVRDLFIPSEIIRRKIEKKYSLIPVPSPASSTTASLYRVQGSSIKLGFISPLSSPFCPSCNKIRLMPDGWLKMCLFGDSGIDLKSLLDKKTDRGKIKEEIRKTVLLKPEKHNLDKKKVNLIMHKVGG